MLKPGIKNQFPFQPETTYLNHGGYGVTPKSVTEAMHLKSLTIEENPAPFFHAECRNLWQSIKAQVAARFKLDNKNIALVQNTTDGINAILRSLSLVDSDEIIIATTTYGAIAKALRQIAYLHGATVIEAKFQFPEPSAEQCLDALKSAFTPRSKLVIIDHITSSTALVMPLVEMIALCRQHGVPVLVDGAHAPGHIPFDIEALQPDWYVANLHKWYFVPRGCGFLWAAPQHHDELMPNVLSWDIDFPFPENFAWTGTRDPASWMAIPDSFAFMDKCGGTEMVIAHNRRMLREAVATLEMMWNIAHTTPDAMMGCMTLVPLPEGLNYALTPEGAHKLEQDLLLRSSIVAPFYCHGEKLFVRIAAQIYNDIRDYERLAQAILSFQKK